MLALTCLSVIDGDHLTPKFSEDGIAFIFVGNVSSGRLHLGGCKYVATGYFDRLSESQKPRRATFFTVPSARP